MEGEGRAGGVIAASEPGHLRVGGDRTPSRCMDRPEHPLLAKLARFGIGAGDTPLLELRGTVRWLTI